MGISRASLRNGSKPGAALGRLSGSGHYAGMQPFCANEDTIKEASR